MTLIFPIDCSSDGQTIFEALKTISMVVGMAKKGGQIKLRNRCYTFFLELGGSSMALIFPIDCCSDGQTTFEALKIYPMVVLDQKRQLHATYRQSQWLREWPKKGGR